MNALDNKMKILDCLSKRNLYVSFINLQSHAKFALSFKFHGLCHSLLGLLSSFVNQLPSIWAN